MAIETSDLQDFRDFIRASDVTSKWEAARRLMAAKQMQSCRNKRRISSVFSQPRKYRDQCLRRRSTARNSVNRANIGISERAVATGGG